MSRATLAAEVEERAAVERTRRSARLGYALRSVVLMPGRGFEAMLARGERFAPYVLSVLGGAGAASVALKVGGLVGARGEADEFRWAFLATALVGGAVVGLGAQILWALAVAFIARARGTGARARGLRIIWGAALLPLIAALIALVPLDLVLVGPEAFTTVPLSGALARAWLAVSIALGVALSAWWMYLLARGVRVAAGLDATRSAAVAVLAPIVLAVVTLVAVWPLRLAT